MRGWKNIFHANGKQKKAGVAILISDKIDLKIENITRNKEGHYIMIKGSIQEEDKTFRKLRSGHLLPSLHCKYMGKQWKQGQTSFWGAPKSLQMVTAAMKLEDTP